MFNAVLVWFRRDLRDFDHAALAEAGRRARTVYCAFVFDRAILDLLTERADRRVEFIRESLVALERTLRARGGALIVRHGFAPDEIPALARALGVEAVFANRDYEPAAKARDKAVAERLRAFGIGFETFKDQAVFDDAEVLTQAGRPYTVFTPYRRAWLARLCADDWAPYPAMAPENPGRLTASTLAQGVPTLEAIGFRPAGLAGVGVSPGSAGADAACAAFLPRLAGYATQREFPAVEGGSRLSVHLRFGTVSIRRLVSLAVAHGALAGESGAQTWLSELIWRDFYFMILDRFPHVVDRAFKPEFDAIEWESGAAADAAFAAWCEGRTGFPLVDAAMRQLNETGFMHNRLRMVSACFLVKDLGLDWRRGEAYFAQRLLDFDLSANNGGWQWAASTGCDAQPYFRIFNPVTQSERFDADGAFIRRYVPELAGLPARAIHAPWKAGPSTAGVAPERGYPPPLVEHDAARRATLARYSVVKRGGGR